MNDAASLKDRIRDRYAQAAKAASAGRGCCGPAPAASGCCNAAPAATGCCDPITSNLYGRTEAGSVPAGALSASLGCGHPTALAALAPGEVVLDLGSGGGIDVLLSAQRVGPTGKAIGLDMTDEMLALAEAHKAQSGLANVEFVKGDIEAIPLPDASVDVVVSNCVINLAADKDRVLRETYRVLRPGGRFAVSDIVVLGEVPDALRRDAELWAGCVAGALSDGDYVAKLREAGFADASIEVTRAYDADDLAALGAGDAPALAGRLVSAFVRARKPA